MQENKEHQDQDQEQNHHDTVLKNLEQRSWTDRFVIGDQVDIQGYTFEVVKLKQLRGELTLKKVEAVRKGMSSSTK